MYYLSGFTEISYDKTQLDLVILNKQNISYQEDDPLSPYTHKGTQINTIMLMPHAYMKPATIQTARIL